MSTSVVQLALGEESIPPGEERHIARLLALHREIQAVHDRAKSPVRRDVHPKQHACVRAALIIEANLSAALRHGLFANGRVYDAVIRFSNAKQQNDLLPDAHGAAIKLVGVEGEPLLSKGAGGDATQDLVLVDHPVFFARNAEDMVLMSETFRDLMIGGPLDKAKAALLAAASPDYRFRMLRKMAKRPDNLLDIPYWSTTPFRLGSTGAKFLLRPDIDRLPARSEGSQDKLRHALAQTLQEHEARFDLMVIPQLDPITTPIEDATVNWEEAGATPQKVGSLVIPPQNFDTEEKRRFGENLSFTPWHGLAAHRPLGGINRARRALYEELARTRREANGAPLREPTVQEINSLFPL